MTALVANIVKDYESVGLSLEEIASEHNISIVEIKTLLLNYSSKYRADMKESKSLDFTDEQLELANRAIVETLQTTEDEHLKLRAAIFIREDKKGRRDVLKGLADLQLNVAEFNLNMRKVLASRERTKAIASPNPKNSAHENVTQVIDIEEAKTV